LTVLTSQNAYGSTVIVAGSKRKTPFKNPFSRWCKNLWVGAELPKSKHKNGFSAKNKKTLQPVRTDNSLRIKSYDHEETRKKSSKIYDFHMYPF
jgi:hypothetical protein